MANFLLISIIGSIVLTILINVIPMLFPRQTQRVERRVHEKIEQALSEDEARRQEGKRPRVHVFFPWKAMLVVSIVLTVLLNGIGLLVR
jgi:hypothetical protein